jgi:ectoine hydroxylase-related dioxygenase (phytanoyl-CoA dioxygenase family)
MSPDAFQRDGFVVIPAVLAESQCDAIATAVSSFASNSPGTRSLLTHDWCRALVAALRARPSVSVHIPVDHVAVQCTYFEKSVDNNWLVPVHQDLSIPVRARVDHPALRGWSQKEGSLFVQPPAELLETLVAVRVHLDPCLEEDGPLQFIPGTHTRGRIDAAEASRLRQDGPVVTCAVERGGALVMRPLALHTSSKATGTSRRRVLHFVFGPPELPHGLQWEYAAG